MLIAKRFLLLLTLLLVTSSTKSDQQNSSSQDHGTEETMRVDVNLVTLGVRVSDRKSRELNGLKQEAFSIFEDGTQQQIAVFASEQQPASVLMLLDRSYSMGQGETLDQAKSALRQFLENGHSDNEYALMVFDDEPVKLVDFVEDRRTIETALGKISSRRSGSSLYDSVVVALDRFDRARYPRQVLVVITDGADQHSRLRLDDVLNAVQGSRAQVYLVGFFDPKEDAIFRDSGKTVTLVSGREIDNPRYVFKRLAEESGAERYFPASEKELETVMRTIAQDLRTQYTLGYYTLPSDHARHYRRIEVRLHPKGLRVRARRGFQLRDAESELPVSAVPVRPTGAETIQQRALSYEIKTERRGEQVIFREDFSDAASGWPQKPGFFLKAGQYHLEQLRPKALNEGRVAANGPWWTDFEASVDVEFQSGRQDSRLLPPEFQSGRQVLHSAPAAAGLVFRLNERGYYALVISEPFGNAEVHYKLIKRVHPAAAQDLLLWEQQWRPGAGRPSRHKLGVVCRGSLIQLQVDGLQVRELRDESLSDGLVGAVLFGEGHAVFDDLVAQSIVE